MLQQIYRRPPSRRAISVKLCSNIIETAHLLRGCLLQICLQTLTAFIQNSLEKLLFVILTFLQVHKHNAHLCQELLSLNKKKSLIKTSSYISTINLHKSLYHISLYQNPQYSSLHIFYFDISHACTIRLIILIYHIHVQLNILIYHMHAQLKLMLKSIFLFTTSVFVPKTKFNF